jgi:hypothetical protein
VKTGKTAKTAAAMETTAATVITAATETTVTMEGTAAEKTTAETAGTAAPTADRTAVRTGMTSQDGPIPNNKTTLRNKNHDREPISASGRTDR